MTSGTSFVLFISFLDEPHLSVIADHKSGNGSLPFCDDPRFSCPLLNPNELLANSPEEAARLLDHCLSVRRQSGSSSSSHMFFTLRLYQYRLDKSGAGGGKFFSVRFLKHFYFVEVDYFFSTAINQRKISLSKNNKFSFIYY